MKLVYATKNGGLNIYVGNGNKGENDFIVYVRTKSGTVPSFVSDPDGRPKHTEWVNLYRDFYRFSHSQNPRFSENKLASLPLELASSTYVRPIKEVGVLPTPRAVNTVPYKGLLDSVEQHVGRYEQVPLDFIVALLELIFVQEVTNYPKGVLHVLLPRMLRDELLGTLPKSAAEAGGNPVEFAECRGANCSLGKPRRIDAAFYKMARVLCPVNRQYKLFSVVFFSTLWERGSYACR